MAAEANTKARALANLVLAEAIGSSLTPFVPVPFVDDYLFARLLRRITEKVTARAGRPVDQAVSKALVQAYVRAGDSSLGTRALTAAARFVVRKVAVVLDVKKSHDVFGETLAFALALDIALELETLHGETAPVLGGAIYRTTQSVGSAALEALSRAGRHAFAQGGPDGFRLAWVSEAIGKQVDQTHASLDHLLRYELTQPPPM